jgi:hypothetical protein
MNEMQNRWTSIANLGVQNSVNALPAMAREYFEERAGILQYCGEIEQADAEGLALQKTAAAFIK